MLKIEKETRTRVTIGECLEAGVNGDAVTVTCHNAGAILMTADEFRQWSEAVMAATNLGAFKASLVAPTEPAKADWRAACHVGRSMGGSMWNVHSADNWHWMNSEGLWRRFKTPAKTDEIAGSFVTEEAAREVLSACPMPPVLQ